MPQSPADEPTLPAQHTYRAYSEHRDELPKEAILGCIDAGVALAGTYSEELGRKRKTMGERNGETKRYEARKQALKTQDTCKVCNVENVDRRAEKKGLKLCFGCAAKVSF